MKVDPPAQLWDRRKGESTKAFGYFRRYLEMGEIRSFEALAAEVGKTANAIRITAHRHRWTQRTAAYDAAARADADREAVRTARTLYDDHKEALQILRKASLQTILRAVQAKQGTFSDGVRGLDVSIRLELLLESEAKGRLAAAADPFEGLDLEALTEDETEQLRAIVTRLRQAG
jgi:hypothetical protein